MSSRRETERRQLETSSLLGVQVTWNRTDRPCPTLDEAILGIGEFAARELGAQGETFFLEPAHNREPDVVARDLTSPSARVTLRCGCMGSTASRRIDVRIGSSSATRLTSETCSARRAPTTIDNSDLRQGRTRRGSLNSPLAKTPITTSRSLGSKRRSPCRTG